MSKKNGMSFGKLLLIFFGGFIFLIIATVVIINLATASKQNTVVTKRHEPSFESADLLAEKMRIEEKNAAKARKLTEDLAKSIKSTLIQQNQIVSIKFDTLSNRLQSLEQRINELEGLRNAQEVKIIKPEREIKTSSLGKNIQALPADYNYKVLATVGKRAWVSEGVNEDSFSVGERLPSMNKPPMIHSIDSNSNTVIIKTKP